MEIRCLIQLKRLRFSFLEIKSHLRKLGTYSMSIVRTNVTILIIVLRERVIHLSGNLDPSRVRENHFRQIKLLSTTMTKTRVTLFALHLSL